MARYRIMTRYKPKQKKMIVEMYKAGMTEGMIERIIGVGRLSIERFLSQENVSSVEGINIKRSKELIKKAIDEGFVRNLENARRILEMIDNVDLSKKGYRGTKKTRNLKSQKNTQQLQERRLMQMGAEGYENMLAMSFGKVKEEDGEER